MNEEKWKKSQEIKFYIDLFSNSVLPDFQNFHRLCMNFDEFPTQNAKTGLRERIICCVTKCFYEYQSKADEIVDFSLSFSKQVHRKVPSMQYFTADVLQESFIVHIRKSAEHEWYFGVSKQSSCCFSLTEKHLSLLQNFLFSSTLQLCTTQLLTKYAILIVVLKFIYSEKAAKFCQIFTLLLSYVVPVKSKVKISQNLVAFSKYINFKIF